MPEARKTPGPKTVLITGASTGIGKSTAEYFSDRGWNVAATMRTPAKASFSNTGADNIKVFQLDVTDEDSIAQAVSETLNAFGRIDVLVNNAGYGLVGLFEAMTPDQIKRQFDTNVIGAMNVTRAIIPVMRDQRAGHIINVASAAGRMSLPLYTLYCSTKWALEGFSEALIYELKAFGIKVRIIEPGPIETDFMTRSLDVADGAITKHYGDFEERVWEAYRNKFEGAPPPVLVAKSIYKAATGRPGIRIRLKPNGWLLMFGRRIVTTMTHVAITGRVLGAWEPMFRWSRKPVVPPEGMRTLRRSQP